MSKEAFDEGNYEPEFNETGKQSFTSLSVLGHRVDPYLFAAVEAKRHAMGFERMVKEVIDIQNNLTDGRALSILKLLCTSAFLLRQTIERCDPILVKSLLETYKDKHIGLSYTLHDDFRTFTLGEVVKILANKANVPQHKQDNWLNMADVDFGIKEMKITPSVVATESPTDVLVEAVLEKNKGKRVTISSDGGGSLSGWLKYCTGYADYRIFKRSDSNNGYDLPPYEKIISITETTDAKKVLYRR